MITKKAAQVIALPVLADQVAGLVSAHLESELTWLTKAYGKVEVLRKVYDYGNVEGATSSVSSNITRVPAIYGSDKEYIDLFPDAHLGTYCYHEFGKQDYEYVGHDHVLITGTVSLVFWFDFHTVYPIEYDGKTVEHVKELVIKALRSIRAPGLRIEVQSSTDDEAEIYRGYSYQKINPIYKMRPYGAFRLSTNYEYKTLCN